MSGTALVIGGGLAGAASACTLARAGLQTTLIERQTQPHDKICGEFLSREAQLHLERLGIDAAALGGQRITHVRLISNTQDVRADLPFAGIGLSRRTLDEALLAKAAEAGVVLRRGQAARWRDGRFELPGHGALRADRVLLATGKHDLHALPREAATGILVGFKTYYRLAPDQTAALCDHVEVILFADGYAGLQTIEGGRANLCLLVSAHRLKRVGGSWDDLLGGLCAESPHLCRRLAGAHPALERPLSIARVPYGFLHPAVGTLHPQVFRLGDQMGVIDSFSGDGMSIALHSAGLATRTILSGGEAAAYHRQMRRDIGGQIGRARLLFRLGQDRYGQSALMRLARLWPGSLGLAARLTRVPPRALARGLA